MENKKTKKNTSKKKGFTLIELLAVIIILGILMIIAIPSVTRYINDSRKNAYIDTAKEIISGARNIVNEGKLEMYDTNSTYYIPTSCIKTENASKSPYGDFTKAYVGIIYNGTGYKYYWISVDDAGQGIRNITPLDKLDIDDIESDLKDSDIEGIVQTTGIGERSEIKILSCNTITNVNSWDIQYHLDNISNNVPEEASNGKLPSEPVCKPATVLHTGMCSRSGSNGCAAKIGTGNLITYGTIVDGTPKAGDAYDCKVTIDGDYTERFYYLKSIGENTILIYSKNMNNQTTYAYDSSDENWYGPRTVYQYLPSTSEWNNPGLISPGTRQIIADNNTTSTSGGTLESFTYTDKAARLLTYQEAISICGKTGISSNGYLDNYTWLMDGLGQFETSNGASGFWLETPKNISSVSAYFITYNRMISYNNVSANNSRGARPVITIKTSDLGN